MEYAKCEEKLGSAFIVDKFIEFPVHSPPTPSKSWRGYRFRFDSHEASTSSRTAYLTRTWQIMVFEIARGQ